MPVKTPQETAAAAVEAGTTKAGLSWDKALVGGFLAGAYIAFGGLVAIAVSSGLKPELWGTLPTLFSGTVFALGLVLVVLAGSELLTGNMALVPIAMMRKRVGFKALGLNFTVVLIGNLIGSLFVAYFLAVKTGVIGVNGVDPATPAGMTFERLKAIAVLKGDTEGADQIFLRALGCNWLVCLAVWVAMTAEDTGGKILGIFFPIMAFVAIGFDHVVANMFFLPAAIFAEVPGVTWGDALYNWAFAFLGNLVGAAVFVSTGYWYLYLRGTPRRGRADRRRPGDAQAGNGRGVGRRASPSARASQPPQREPDHRPVGERQPRLERGRRPQVERHGDAAGARDHAVVHLDERADAPAPRARRVDRGDPDRHRHGAEQPRGAAVAGAHDLAEPPGAAHVRRPFVPARRPRQQLPRLSRVAARLRRPGSHS